MATTLPTVVYKDMSEADLKGSMAEFNAWRKQVTDAINYMLGSYGASESGAGLKLNGVLDMAGSKIINVGSGKQTLG